MLKHFSHFQLNILLQNNQSCNENKNNNKCFLSGRSGPKCTFLSAGGTETDSLRRGVSELGPLLGILLGENGNMCQVQSYPVFLRLFRLEMGTCEGLYWNRVIDRNEWFVTETKLQSERWKRNFIKNSFFSCAWVSYLLNAVKEQKRGIKEEKLH